VYEAGLLRFMLSRRIELVIKVKKKELESILKWLLGMVYAQSWTSRSEESDAMWRIYSTGGVRIGVEDSDLRDAIEEHCKDSPSGEVEIIEPMDIEYDNMISIHQNFSLKDISADFIRYALMYKRPAFEYEKEFRFAVYYKNEFNLFKEYLGRILDESATPISDEILQALITSKSTTMKFKFKLDKIKEVYFDPLAPMYQVDTFEKYCENRGFKEKGIHYQQSQLYTNNF